jgi:hypothetical protein
MIPSLNEMTVGQRFLLTIIIVLVILFALAAFGYFGGRWDEAQGQAVTEGYSVPERFHDDVLALDHRALDEAYVQQGLHLFRTWITDRLHDPSGIDKGLSKARQGYVLARERIERRGNAPTGQPR